MQGVSVTDVAGNLVRVIDFVRGPSIYRHLRNLDLDHETYFHQALPSVMTKLLETFDALAFLRQKGEQHGDVRNDHILIERDTGRLRLDRFRLPDEQPRLRHLVPGQRADLRGRQGKPLFP
jgi:hypothetical protein